MDKKSYEEFLKNLTLGEIVIFGVSSRAEACFEWIIGNFPDSEVVGFLAEASDSSDFCKKRVLSFDEVKLNSEAVIIYAERDMCEIGNLASKYELSNEFLIFYYAKPYLGICDVGLPENDIRKLYQAEDSETQLFLDNFFLAKSFDWALLLPREAVDWIARYNKRYWDRVDNDLGACDELTFLDCGAYTGDSLKDFYQQYNSRLCYAYAVEADKTKQIALESAVAELGLCDKVEIIMKGVSDEAGDYFIEHAGTTSGKVAQAGEQAAHTVRIDDLNIQPVGKLCIKMDIEGLEMPALKGAAETIKKFAPEMAICIYHKGADIFEIPQYIKSLCPEYKFIIRGGVHSVCYCSVERF